MTKEERELQGFNVRVYGILIDRDRVLVSIENPMGSVIHNFLVGVSN